eukprot:gene5843-8063_t
MLYGMLLNNPRLFIFVAVSVICFSRLLGQDFETNKNVLTQDWINTEHIERQLKSHNQNVSLNEYHLPLGHGRHDVRLNLPRCGGLNHSQSTRPCRKNDEYCGTWKGRYWYPYGCNYQDINPEQARKCIGNRTIAFIGDSQSRDIAVGVAYLLMGMTLEKSSDKKFDKNFDINTNATKIENFPFWSNNVPPHNYNGHLFPKENVKVANNWHWQIQIWSLYCNNFLRNQIEDITRTQKCQQHNNKINKIDFAFWGHGLHDWGWFEKPPQGERFYNHIVHQWIVEREKSQFPIVWMGMNNNCMNLTVQNISPERSKSQYEMVEEGNRYANEKLLREKLPYWDTPAVLRTQNRCDKSADGVHTKMYVDLMRAKMLFNHLCDENMNWRASIDHFM